MRSREPRCREQMRASFPVTNLSPGGAAAAKRAPTYAHCACRSRADGAQASRCSPRIAIVVNMNCSARVLVSVSERKVPYFLRPRHNKMKQQPGAPPTESRQLDPSGCTKFRSVVAFKRARFNLKYGRYARRRADKSRAMMVRLFRFTHRRPWNRSCFLLLCFGLAPRALTHSDAT